MKGLVRLGAVVDLQGLPIRHLRDKHIRLEASGLIRDRTANRWVVHTSLRRDVRHPRISRLDRLSRLFACQESFIEANVLGTADDKRDTLVNGFCRDF